MHIAWRRQMTRVLRAWLRSLSLWNHGLCLVAQTRNGLLAVDPRDFGVSSALLRDGAYDWNGVLWLSALLDPASRLVFVGAHLGSLLVPLALRSGARHIVAFEPSPANHRLLQMNLRLNGLADVTLHQMAIGDREGTLRFTQNRLNTGNSHVSAAGEVVVQSTTLDAALPPGPVDLLVMDTEGFECHAVRGGARTLGETRYLHVEYAPDQLAEHGSTAAELIEWLMGLFPSMYLQEAGGARFFPSGTYASYLRRLPARRDLLLNLLFSKDRVPNPALLAPERAR